MSRKYLKYVRVDFNDFPAPGYYHDPEYGYTPDGICQHELPGENDCPACEHEHLECSDIAMGRLEKEGFDVWDIMLTNLPGMGPGDPDYWEWECLVSKAK